jgi:hypothetical protein
MLAGKPGCSAMPVGIFIVFMFSAVFTCVTTSTLAGNSTLPLTWSKCVCVLMIVVIGLSVTSLIFAISGWPHPGFLVSTTTTPLAVMNTPLFPPPPVIT